MIRHELHNGWTGAAAGGPVPESIAGRTLTAFVPGVVHTDLLAAGAIPDPYAMLRKSTGYGPQARHELVVSTPDDRRTMRVGFRTVEIDATSDGFQLRVNDVPAFVRGANWIPDDAFHPLRDHSSSISASFRTGLTPTPPSTGDGDPSARGVREIPYRQVTADGHNRPGRRAVLRTANDLLNRSSNVDQELGSAVRQSDI